MAVNTRVRWDFASSDLQGITILGCIAFTGFDTVSVFRGHGKRTAWNVWSVFGSSVKSFVR